ncbi:MAG TPA: NAD(P)H-hydrate epimerase [bacterium]|mgnify:CR=1 FL=1|nr:NAD(P)H-hydrate epimerase [bacterium]HOL35416.1 NAD(P)H-hydrate epimerase [bacterium]HPP08805.1 NAD(P)H-hydrate epimerase [bacterium]
MKKIILSREEIYEREKIAYERYGIPPLILMENAGRQTALEVIRTLKKYRKRNTIVLSGPGNNGGDGMAAARYLHCYDLPVSVFITLHPDKLKEPSFTNYQILVKMNLISFLQDIEILRKAIRKSDLIVDAIFGVGLTRPVEGIYKEIINEINTSDKYVISADIPSGIDANTGVPYSIAVKADTTVTFGFGKSGLYTEKGKIYAGKVKIVDIGYPPELYF